MHPDLKNGAKAERVPREVMERVRDALKAVESVVLTQLSPEEMTRCLHTAMDQPHGFDWWQER